MTKSRGTIYKLAETDAIMSGFFDGLGFSSDPNQRFAKATKELAEAKERLIRAKAK